MGYTRASNAIWAVTQAGLSGPNSVVYTKDNIQQRNIFALSLEVPYESKFYNCFNTLAVNFSTFYDERPAYTTRNPTNQLYVYSYHQILWPKGFNIDLTGEYYGAASDGFAKRGPYYYVTLGLSRSFLKNKLNGQLTFNDIFKTARFKGIRTIGTFTNAYDQRINSHYLRLSITYRLGGIQNFKYRNKAVNEKEFNRIKM